MLMASKYPEMDDGPPEYLAALAPERILLACIMERAVRDALGYVNYGPKAKSERDAKAWINTSYIQPPDFSFEWICECLGYNPNKIRIAIKRGNLPAADDSRPETYFDMLRGILSEQT